MENTYLVVLQHIDIPLSQVFATLVMVHTLDLLAFGEVVSDDTSFHSLDPRFADVLLTSFQFRCIVVEPKRPNAEVDASAKQNDQLGCAWGRHVGGHGGGGVICLPSMSAALVSLTGMEDLRNRKSEEERRRLEVAGSARGYRGRRRFQKSAVQQLLVPHSQRAVSYCVVRRILYPRDVGKCVVTRLALRNSNRLRTAFPIHQHEIFGLGSEPKGVGYVLSLMPTTCARRLSHLTPTMPICRAPEPLCGRKHGNRRTISHCSRVCRTALSSPPVVAPPWRI